MKVEVNLGVEKVGRYHPSHNPTLFAALQMGGEIIPSREEWLYNRNRHDGDGVSITDDWHMTRRPKLWANWVEKYPSLDGYVYKTAIAVYDLKRNQINVAIKSIVHFESGLSWDQEMGGRDSSCTVSDYEMSENMWGQE